MDMMDMRGLSLPTDFPQALFQACKAYGPNQTRGGWCKPSAASCESLARGHPLTAFQNPRLLQEATWSSRHRFASLHPGPGGFRHHVVTTRDAHGAAWRCPTAPAPLNSCPKPGPCLGRWCGTSWARISTPAQLREMGAARIEPKLWAEGGSF